MFLKLLLIMVALLIYCAIGSFLQSIIFSDDDMSIVINLLWPLVIFIMIAYKYCQICFDMGKKAKREYKNRKQ